MKNLFFETASKYSDNSYLIKDLWDEIEQSYSSSHRHYHNLIHIEDVIHQISFVKNEISDWDTILFSAFYHDIVYDIKSPTNEEDSALIAKDRLQSLSYPSEKINRCISQILATKSHEISEDHDSNLFTDADLAILGTDIPQYKIYTQQIREEYIAYPDSIYKKGRKEILERMLQMDHIYKSNYFYRNFEEKARANIAKEIEIITL